MITRTRSWGLLALLLCACGGGGGGGDTDGGGDGSIVGPPDAPPGFTVRDRARALATALRGDGDFMIGVGNDNDGPYTQGVPIDLHYAYLVGYGDQGGWTTWNTDGQYASIFAQNADDHGATPMFTYYQLALEMENGNDGVLADTTRMHQYLADVRLLYTRLAEFGKPAVVGFEPDYFGYLMQRAANGTPPDQIPAAVHFDDMPECQGLAENAIGLMQCVVVMGHALAPQVKIGFHASRWGAWFDDTDPNADVEGSAAAVGQFLLTMGGDLTDFVGLETLDRDAGFWEANGGGNTCDLGGGSRGPVYWDESNTTFPNFAQHLRWVHALTETMQRPGIWWQTPFGLPDTTCGSNEHWRDNRAHYFFSHLADLADAGGAGMAFGTGAGGQTNLSTDGDHWKNAAVGYMASPLPL